MMFCFKGTVSQDFLLQVYLMNHLLPIRRDIRKSKYINSINDNVNFFPTGTAGVVDTGGKFGEEDGPQMRICRLTKFVVFVNLPQVWQFADL